MYIYIDTHILYQLYIYIYIYDICFVYLKQVDLWTLKSLLT